MARRQVTSTLSVGKGGAFRVDFKGPFFTKDPSLTVVMNIHRMLEALAKEAEADVRAMVPVRSGATRAGIVGRTHSLAGTPWKLWMVVSQQREFPWERKGTRGFSGRSQAVYRGGKLEARTHAFRRVASGIRRARSVIAANLTEGIE